MVLSQGKATFYIDGVAAGSGKMEIPADVRRSSNYFGRSNDPDDAFFSGLMDEMRLWNTARLPGEILGGMFQRIPVATPPGFLLLKGELHEFGMCWAVSQQWISNEI